MDCKINYISYSDHIIVIQFMVEGNFLSVKLWFYSVAKRNGKRTSDRSDVPLSQFTISYKSRLWISETKPQPITENTITASSSFAIIPGKGRGQHFPNPSPERLDPLFPHTHTQTASSPYKWPLFGIQHHIYLDPFYYNVKSYECNRTTAISAR